MKPPFLTHLYNDLIILKNENLKKYNTFKVGGNANWVFIIKSKTTLYNVCLDLQIHHIKFKIIGFGANLLFTDCGFDGVIIVNQTRKITIKNNYVYADSGVAVTALISELIKHGLSGIERLAGIPSTLGGAVTNNLGAFGTEISNFIEYVECYNLKNLNKKLRLKACDCAFKYRDSLFKNNEYLITKIKLKLNSCSPQIVKENMLYAVKQKIESQPLNYPSAGSVFKRDNAGNFEIIPAKIIDELGLKGFRVGGAEISKKHAGFIINSNNATSEDILNLINMVKEKVKLIKGIDLKLEVEIVN